MTITQLDDAATLALAKPAARSNIHPEDIRALYEKYAIELREAGEKAYDLLLLEAALHQDRFVIEQQRGRQELRYWGNISVKVSRLAGRNNMDFLRRLPLSPDSCNTAYKIPTQSDAYTRTSFRFAENAEELKLCLATEAEFQRLRTAGKNLRSLLGKTERAINKMAQLKID